MLEQTLVKTATALVMPPGSIILALVAGLLALGRWPRAGRALIVAATSAVYLLSTPFVSGALSRALVDFDPLPDAAALASGGAIVVLGGGVDDRAFEIASHGHTVSTPALVRLRYAARLHRRTGLPVLVTGGTVLRRGVPEAELMRETLLEDFGVTVRWSEDRSRNTWENATLSAEILARERIERIVLVTHASHMRRAIEAFRRAGLAVVPAPTKLPAFASLASPTSPAARAGEPERDARAATWLWPWLPSAGALEGSRRALHEIVGRWWYRLRYRGT